VVKLASDFDIPTSTLTTILKNQEKIISDFFLSEYTRKHDTVSSNLDQSTLLALNPRLWHWTNKPF